MVHWWSPSQSGWTNQSLNKERAEILLQPNRIYKLHLTIKDEHNIQKQVCEAFFLMGKLHQ